MSGPGAAASALLLGSDHTVLGELATVEVAPGVAIGLTRGAYPKGYPYVDPNEDAAFAAVAGPSSLLVVADGHNGAVAAEAAVTALAGAAPGLLTAPNPPARLDATLEQARTAVAEATRELDPPRAGSATALTACLVAGPEVVVGSAGDTVALRIGPRKDELLTSKHSFLRSSSRPGCFRITTTSLGDGEGLLLMTDGIYGFLGRHWRSEVAAAARAHPSALVLVESLVGLAALGGAGDNGAVVAYQVVGTR